MIKQTQLLQNIVICQWPADPLFADCAPLTATSKKAIGLDHVYTGPDKFLDGKFSTCATRLHGTVQDCSSVCRSKTCAVPPMLSKTEPFACITFFFFVQLSRSNGFIGRSVCITLICHKLKITANPKQQKILVSINLLTDCKVSRQQKQACDGSETFQVQSIC